MFLTLDYQTTWHLHGPTRKLLIIACWSILDETMRVAKSIKIEGFDPRELLAIPGDQIDGFILCGEPIAFRIGSAELLGQFALCGDALVIELAHIDGGGEGVLLTLWSLAEQYASKKQLKRIEWMVHAVDCAEPNLKLRRVLELKGFVIETVAHGVQAYHYLQELPTGQS